MPISETQRLILHNRVTTILAEASDLDAAAAGCLETIGAGSEWAWGSLWMFDEAAGNLRIHSTWSAPDFVDEAFKSASAKLRFEPGQGLPGLTWSEGRPYWMEDLLNDSRFVRRESARQAGLQSGFAFPVRLQERVLGVMAFFATRHRRPDADFLEMMAFLGSQMGQFIERKLAEERLRRSEERYRTVIEQSGEGIYLFDLDSGQILESNPAFRQLLGYGLDEMTGLRLEDVIAHDVESIRANVQKLRDNGHFRIGERKYKRKDGSLAAVDITLNRLPLPGAALAVAIVHDLSARREAEAERDRLAEILEATSDFVGIANPEGQEIYGNRAMRHLRGLGSLGLGGAVKEAHPPWAARILTEEALPTAMREGHWRGESAFLDGEGREVPVSQLILAHRDPEGQIRFFSTVARDISSEKARELDLQNAVKRLEDLRFAVDESTIFAITDARGVITEVNARFCEVSGYARDELIGKTHAILKSGEHPKAFFEEMWDVISSGRVWRGEMKNRAKDGSFYWVDTTIVPWLDAEGRPERYMALRTVITEKKRAEEALLRREKQLEALVTAAREINTDLDIHLVLRRLVESALRLTDATHGTFGMLDDHHLVFHEALWHGTWSTFHFTFRRGEGVPGHVMESLQPYVSNEAGADPRIHREVRSRLGLYNLVSLPILGRKGELLGAIQIHNTRDRRPFDESDVVVLQGLAANAAVALENALRLEEERRRDEALRHTQKLESLGLLAGGIAHDFNNLLSAILGNLGLAVLETPEDSAAARHLQNIDRAVTRAADLTRQMLAYAGKGKRLVKRVDLNAAVEDMARLLEASISKKIRLVFSLCPGLPGLLADPSQIEQLIMNLVINAADAIGEKEGTIQLETSLQVLAESELAELFPGQTMEPGSYLRLDVTDDGSGIPPDVLDRIFDPFFTTKTRGRGLGLSTMHGILRAQGGGISIRTEQGRGTTFRVFLPELAGGSAVQERPDEARPWKGQGTLLVVDDDDVVRATVRAQVQSMGFQVLEARHGLEALNVFAEQKEHIDLVLMDFTMPHLDGREALEGIRALDPKALVILCSGYEEDVSPLDGEAEAPSAFLQKPFRMEDLRRAVREVLESRGDGEIARLG
ncbi:MAG TPA: PAS domain S-box protein [Geothrix sp.]|nr:PAS domain S-box protein [Geothrix sp.]